MKTNTSPSLSNNTINASSIRRTIRLIHCLQKERGATCGASASLFALKSLETKQAPSHRDFHKQVSMTGRSTEVMLETMENARMYTDSAMRELLFNNSSLSSSLVSKSGFHYGNTGVPSLHQSLLHIRSMFDKNQYNSRIHRRIFSAFNTLISNIIQDQIVAPYSFMLEDTESKQPTRGRTQSMMEDIMKSQKKKKEGIFDDEKSIPRSSSDDKINYTCESNHSNNETNSKINEQFVIKSDIFKRRSSTPNIEDPIKPSKATCSLLTVLLAFIRLKESVGIERATLSILLPLSSTTQSVEHLVNDLVLEIENQRHLVFELRTKVQTFQPSYKFLVSLVEQSVTLSPELMILHNLISKDFDLVGFRDAVASPESFWKVISLFIDRLHTLELLIIEEIGSSLAFETNFTDSITPILNTISITPIVENKASIIKDEFKQSYLQTHYSELDVVAIALGQTQATTEQILEAKKKIKSFTPDYLKLCILQLIEEEQSQTSTSSKFKKELARRESAPIILPSDEAHAKKDWMIDLYEIKFLKRIGRGIAGTTYLAKWNEEEVAVKVAAMTEIGQTGFESEVKILQQLHHPNIIQLLGSIVSKTPQTNCLVLEYCNGGDLTDAMNNPTPSNFFAKVVESVVAGMVFLHSKGMMHRDIKPDNVLLHGDFCKGDYVVKLTDFGLSTLFMGAQGRELTAETGTYRWMAPEIIKHQPYSYKADVYSFAIVTWQLLTREDPFAPINQVQAAGMVAFENLRPPFPPNTPKSIMQFIERCWADNPEERTSFQEIANLLEETYDTLSNEEKIWIQSPIGHSVYNFDDTVIPQNRENDEEEDGEEDEQKNATSIYSSVIPMIAKKKKKFTRFFSKKM